MAHYAKLENNVVVTVLVVDDSHELGGIEIGEQYMSDKYGGVWKKTSYNTSRGEHKNGGKPFRKNYGAIGYTYDEQRNAFIPPKEYNSWILDEKTCQWMPPVPHPNQKNIDRSVEAWNKFECGEYSSEKRDEIFAQIDIDQKEFWDKNVWWDEENVQWVIEKNITPLV